MNELQIICGLATTTISKPSPIFHAFSLNISLNILFARFLLTAPPTLFPATTPTRDIPRVGRTKIVMHLP